MLSPIKLWRNQKKIKYLIGKRGVISSFTVVRVPPSGFEAQAPYVVAIVNMGRNNMIGQIVDTDIDSIKTGQKVISVIRKVNEPHPEGIIQYGIKFKLY